MAKSRALGAALVGSLFVGFGVLRNRLRRFEITEDSMEPTLSDGDYVVGTRLVSVPLRGDVVVFPHPRDPGFLMIKRVIGLPGETISIREGRVTVNGRFLTERWTGGAARGTFEWELGDRQLIVLSDNRAVSTEDSRELGPLPMGELWRIAFRYWPLRRVGPIA